MKPNPESIGENRLRARLAAQGDDECYRDITTTHVPYPWNKRVSRKSGPFLASFARNGDLRCQKSHRVGTPATFSAAQPYRAAASAYPNRCHSDARAQRDRRNLLSAPSAIRHRTHPTKNSLSFRRASGARQEESAVLLHTNCGGPSLSLRTGALCR